MHITIPNCYLVLIYQARISGTRGGSSDDIKIEENSENNK
jgi:hypothetical protein